MYRIQKYEITWPPRAQKLSMNHCYGTADTILTELLTELLPSCRLRPACASMNKYFVTRGKLVSRVAKYPGLQDYLVRACALQAATGTAPCTSVEPFRAARRCHRGGGAAGPTERRCRGRVVSTPAAIRGDGCGRRVFARRSSTAPAADSIASAA